MTVQLNDLITEYAQEAAGTAIEGNVSWTPERFVKEALVFATIHRTTLLDFLKLFYSDDMALRILVEFEDISKGDVIVG